MRIAAAASQLVSPSPANIDRALVDPALQFYQPNPYPVRHQFLVIAIMAPRFAVTLYVFGEITAWICHELNKCFCEAS